MATKLLIAALLAFMVAFFFGKYYVPWLRRRGATQPLKKEVAKIYEEKDADLENGK